VVGVALLAGCPDWFGGDGDWGGQGELDPPYDLVATIESDGSISLSWNMDDGQEYDGFIVERRDDSTNFEEIATVGAGNTGYWDVATLSAGTTYYYRVGAYRDGEEPCWCNEVSVEIAGSGGTDGSSITLAPPDWIQGTWTDEGSGSVSYSFSADNVVFESTYGSSIDFNQYNSQYADSGAYYDDEIVSSTRYEVHWYSSGSVNTTYSFEQITTSSLTYHDGTSTLTLVK
jgi:hypothetical protein